MGGSRRASPASDDRTSPEHASARRRIHVMRDVLFSRGRVAWCAAISLHMIGMPVMIASSSAARDGRRTGSASAETCAGDNGGITLPPGFCASVFADNIGPARQMVVAPNGVVYVNTWSGSYYRNDK